MKKMIQVSLLVAMFATTVGWAECTNPVYSLIETATSSDSFPDAFDTQYDKVMVIGKGANTPTISVTANSCSTPPCECGRLDVSPYNTDSNFPTASTYYGTSHPMVINTNKGKPNRVYASVYMKATQSNPGKKWNLIQKNQSGLNPCTLTDADGVQRYFFKVTFCD